MLHGSPRLVTTVKTQPLSRCLISTNKSLENPWMKINNLGSQMLVITGFSLIYFHPIQGCLLVFTIGNGCIMLAFLHDHSYSLGVNKQSVRPGFYSSWIHQGSGVRELLDLLFTLLWYILLYTDVRADESKSGCEHSCHCLLLGVYYPSFVHLPLETKDKIY